MTVRIEGVNLERLLRTAAQAGLVIGAAQRTGTRAMRLRVRADQLRQLEAICAQSGWTCTRERLGRLMRLGRLLKGRPMLVPSMALCAALVLCSSQMILRIRIDGAQESAAQVRHVLSAEGVHPGRWKGSVELEALRAVLAHRLPGLRYAGAYFAGSTLVIDCHGASQGESLRIAGVGTDIVAAQSGIVSRIWASSGTPVVEPGQAVRRGQVLIAGMERGEKGEQIPVQAQGQVFARVYAQGEAKVSLTQRHKVETGNTRTRVTLRTPWTARVVRGAQPFASQDTDRQIQRVVGLYLPLWREKETFVQTQVHTRALPYADAASMAQGAAEKIAAKQCPPDALILDKIVNYSMIDNEFVYASVALAYEAPIAGRIP